MWRKGCDNPVVFGNVGESDWEVKWAGWFGFHGCVVRLVLLAIIEMAYSLLKSFFVIHL